MLRRKKKDFDEILERYLPPSSNKDIESARDRFLVVLRERHELQEALDNFRTPKPVIEGKFVSLEYIDQLVLTAIHLLRGEGTSLGVADKVDTLVTSKVFDTAAVFIALDRMERGRLISSRRIEAPEEGGVKVFFSITPEGQRMLKEVRSAAKQLADALEEFK